MTYIDGIFPQSKKEITNAAIRKYLVDSVIAYVIAYVIGIYIYINCCVFKDAK